VQYTHSPLGQRVLDDWKAKLGRFVKVMPVDYKRILLERKHRKREIA
jgi:glutamate synthase domain-containing protein 3